MVATGLSRPACSAALRTYSTGRRCACGRRPSLSAVAGHPAETAGAGLHRLGRSSGARCSDGRRCVQAWCGDTTQRKRSRNGTASRRRLPVALGLDAQVRSDSQHFHHWGKRHRPARAHHLAPGFFSHVAPHRVRGVEGGPIVDEPNLLPQATAATEIVLREQDAVHPGGFQRWYPRLGEPGVVVREPPRQMLDHPQHEERRGAVLG